VGRGAELLRDLVVQRSMFRDTTQRFFALAFALTWTLQVPGVLARRGLLPGDPAAYLAAAMLGVFGPLMAAVYFTWKEHGRLGVNALLFTSLARRVSLKWCVLGLLIPGALLSLFLWAMRAAGTTGDWLFLPNTGQMIAGLVISYAEEVGWRAFALPRLAARHGSFVASCILGVLWAMWHVPMFLAVDIPMSLMPVMLLFFVGGSLFYTYLYFGSGGSLLVAVLAHLGAHLDNSHAALPADTLPLVVHTVIYTALGFGTMRATALQRRPVKLTIVI
jgi:membrane protease YdiL (CAAX protease family)